MRVAVIEQTVIRASVVYFGPMTTDKRDTGPEPMANALGARPRIRCPRYWGSSDSDSCTACLRARTRVIGSATAKGRPLSNDLRVGGAPRPEDSGRGGDRHLQLPEG